MDWLVAAYGWWQGLNLATQISVVAGIIAIVDLVSPRKWIIKGLAWLWRSIVEHERRAPLEGLTAGEPLATPHFTGRQEERERLATLIENHHVCAVEGPPLIGKSWLISEVIKSSGMAERCIFIELKRKSGLSALLFAINAGMMRLGRDEFDGICRSDEQTPTEKAQGLRPLLVDGNWLIVLDAYEGIEAGGEIDETIESWSKGIGDSRVVLGTRRNPSWLVEGAAVDMPPMPAGEMEDLCRNLGLSEAGAKEVCGQLAGLPGAAGLFRGVFEEKGESAAAARKLVGKNPEKLGRTLFDAAFRAAPQAARDVWMVASWFPQPLTREAVDAICGEDAFKEGVSLLERWTVLTEGSERLDLHAWARRTGKRAGRWMALPWHGSKRWAWGQQAARFYAAFAEEKADDRDAIEAELENILAAARVAFQYKEWEALWAMGNALDDPLEYAGRWTTRARLLVLCCDGAWKAKDRKQVGNFAHNLGVALQQRGALKEAEDLYRQGLAAAREVGDRPGEAKTLHQLGMVAEDRGKLEGAEDLYNQSLEMKREVGDRPGEAQTLHQLGRVAQHRGRLEEAEGLYNRSLEIKQEVGDRRGEAKTLHQLGMVVQDRGKLEEAEGYYNESLEIKREVGDRPGEAKTRHQLGMVAEDRGKLEEAEGGYNESLEIAREVGDRPGEAITMHQLGMVAQDRGKLEEAEDFYRQSLEIEREVGDRPSEALTLAQMALLAEEQGDVGLAVARMEKAAAMFEEMGLAEAGQARGELERLKRRVVEEG